MNALHSLQTCGVILILDDIMTIPDYITFPRTFENYRWYKPILVFILSSIIFLILGIVITVAFYVIVGPEFVQFVFKGGYEALISPMAIFFTDLLIIILIPSIYLASKIIKDRPFSSYSSSRGGWNFKLYLNNARIPRLL